jgi:hypothetical protein
MKVKNTPETISVIKFNQILISPEPMKIKGSRIPKKKLRDKETANPKY